MKLLVLIALIDVASAAVQFEITKVASLRTRLKNSGLWTNHRKYKEVLRVQNKPSNLATIHQPINGIYEFGYVANITIGTPGQPFVVYLDFLSANLWVPDKSCKTCQGVKMFDQTKSSTYVTNGQSLTIQDGGAIVNGFLGQDTITFVGTGASLVVPKTVFGQATSVDSNTIGDSKTDPQFFDGYLGLAFQSLAVDNVVPPLMNAINQGLFDNPYFTVYLQGKGIDSDYAPRGVFTYGGLDTQNCGSLIAWQPFSSATYFQFRMASIAVGSYSSSKGWDVISDPGAAGIFGPQSITDAMAKAIGATYEADGDYQYYIIDCNASPPPVKIGIGSNTYTVTNKQLKFDNGVSGQCYWEVAPYDFGGFGASWVLGSPFVVQYCNTYDLSGKRVGFSPANGA
uniref:Peptidase A1 domain-containing protein n=1 Tax=Acrobeloides nanus TaxID=290746 RepID=A0A914E249_9BILA